MKYIVDTHAFIWYATGNDRLGKQAKAILDSAQEKYLTKN